MKHFFKAWTLEPDWQASPLSSCVTLGKLLILSAPQVLATISVVVLLLLSTWLLPDRALSFSPREQERKAAVKVLLGLSELEVTFCLRRPRRWAVY